MSAVYRNLRRGSYKIVYVAPERLTGEGFVALCRQLDLSLLAVDEAHCISQRGQDLRPSYLKISEFLAQLPRRPVLAAFTATATEAVRKDIAQILGLQDPLCMITGFDRPNLFFDVLQPQKRSSELALSDCRTQRQKRHRILRHPCHGGAGLRRSQGAWPSCRPLPRRAGRC